MKRKKEKLAAPPNIEPGVSVGKVFSKIFSCQSRKDASSRPAFCFYFVDPPTYVL